MKLIEVVAAIIENQNQILCVQRGESKYPYISKKYEFPGGKVELNESLENALIREIFEELELKIVVEKHVSTVLHHYPDFSIKMHGFLCRSDSRDLILREHLHAVWLDRSELNTLDWAGADVPFVQNMALF